MNFFVIDIVLIFGNVSAISIVGIDSKVFAMIVEDKLQPRTKNKDDGKGKEIIPSPNPKEK